MIVFPCDAKMSYGAGLTPTAVLMLDKIFPSA